MAVMLHAGIEPKLCPGLPATSYTSFLRQVFMKMHSYSSIPIEQLFDKLLSSPSGITQATAERRIKEQSKSFKAESRLKKEIKLLIRQFINPLMLLLLVAVALSAISGESSDSLIILFILLTTGLLSFWQEVNAGRAMEKLRNMIEMKHTVLRDGKVTELPGSLIVPGDILMFDAGDIIPADCRLVETNELHVNESSLTGESFPVEKWPCIVPENDSLPGKNNCLWQGTNIASGSAKALVVNTGRQTIFGQMAHSLEQTHETVFETGIKRFGYFLLRITVILAFVILVTNLYFKKPLFDSVMFSLALAVGMAPELLPAIMTFAMSAGAKKMLKKKVIVKKLSSIFNFGEVNVLCTDKTGTLTEGNVTVKEIVDIDGRPNDRIKLFAFLNASFQNGFTNPVDKAIAELPLCSNGYSKINEIPYDFIRKRLSVAVTNEEETFFITKGAFKSVLEVCRFAAVGKGGKEELNDAQRKLIESSFVDYSEQGFRVLGISYKPLVTAKISREDEKEMIFLGFILLEDPLKETALKSIQELEKLHIRTKIITGDNRFAAVHTARKIGMERPSLLTGDEIRKLSAESLIVKAKEVDLFAEIEPQQKELIIKALQRSKFVVAYIGDGVNDVAAINAADIGISTNNASDVAKEAADFVLLEKDLSVLADGTAEGRRSFANSMKYILITTGATFGNMFSVAGASLFLPFMPMLPKQILFTNLVTDLPFLTIASDNVDEEQTKEPGKWNLKMIRRFMIVFGIHSSIFDFLTFYILYFYLKLPQAGFQTGWFLESAITEIIILFIIRTRKSFIKSRPGNLLIVLGMLAVFITIVAPWSPAAASLGFSVPSIQLLLAITALVITYTISADFLKVYFFTSLHRARVVVKHDTAAPPKLL